IATPAPATGLLTYEQYMAEGEEMRRYDIIDGVRIYMNPTRLHQRLLQNLAGLLRDFEAAFRRGKVYIAPCDLLVTRTPLRTRQPDVLFMSNERVAQCPEE